MGRRCSRHGCLYNAFLVKILVIGNGGREHALVWKLRQAKAVERIFCAPGNAGTATIAENIAIPATDLLQLRDFAKKNAVDLTVVGPDDPLALGIVDLFNADKLRIFGPTKSAARLESSKIFAKELMRAQKVPTAEARTFSDSAKALDYCEKLKYPVVIKADGLALGKGVIIATDLAEAKETISGMMDEARFGDAGRQIVIEEFLRGTECSLHALVDGKNYRLLESARDHKRALDGDQGPNTGGMGAFSPANNWNSRLQSQFEDQVMRPLLDGLQEGGVAYRGLLYPGLMITETGPRVLEFNCRFGDPETQPILMRLQSDLTGLCEAALEGRLNEVSAEWDPRAALGVVMAAAGYPEEVRKGDAINGLDRAAALPGKVFHAGTRMDSGRVVTSGGRVLCAVGLGASVTDAQAQAYGLVNSISWAGVQFRHDVGYRAIAREHAGS
jgi:phosphoribosylamine--glycine ligase